MDTDTIFLFYEQINIICVYFGISRSSFYVFLEFDCHGNCNHIRYVGQLFLLLDDRWPKTLFTSYTLYQFLINRNSFLLLRSFIFIVLSIMKFFATDENLFEKSICKVTKYLILFLILFRNILKASQLENVTKCKKVLPSYNHHVTNNFWHLQYTHPCHARYKSINCSKWFWQSSLVNTLSRK